MEIKNNSEPLSREKQHEIYFAICAMNLRKLMYYVLGATCCLTLSICITLRFPDEGILLQTASYIPLGIAMSILGCYMARQGNINALAQKLLNEGKLSWENYYYELTKPEYPTENPQED